MSLSGRTKSDYSVLPEKDKVGQRNLSEDSREFVLPRGSQLVVRDRARARGLHVASIRFRLVARRSQIDNRVRFIWVVTCRERFGFSSETVNSRIVSSVKRC